MKKFFMFMAAALMTFSLASCDKKDKNEPETPAQDTTAVVTPSFQIVVSDVDATSAYLKVTPSDAKGYYISGIYDAEILTEYKAKDIADYFKKSYGIYVIMGYATMDDLVDAGYLNQGEAEGLVDGLAPETEYAAIALYIDSAFNVIGDWNYKKFKTEKLEIIGQETVSLENCKLIDYVAEDGWYQIIGANADSTFYLSLSPDASALTDHITADMLDPEYSVLYLNKQDAYGIYEASLDGAVNDDIFTLSGYFVAGNGIKYNVTLSANIASEEEEKEEEGGEEGGNKIIKKIGAKHNALKKYDFKK